MDSGPVKAKGNEPAPQSTYHDRRTAKENPALARAGTDHGVKLLGRQPARALSRRSEQQVDDKAWQLSAKILKLFAAKIILTPPIAPDEGDGRRLSSAGEGMKHTEHGGDADATGNHEIRILSREGAAGKQAKGAVQADARTGNEGA